MKASIVGSGIVGLAHALAFAKRGFEVTVFERHSAPLGASVRNFGLFWPIGQELAMLQLIEKSKEIWNELIREAQIDTFASSSLILAYSKEEFDLMQEFYKKEAPQRGGISLLQPRELAREHLMVNQENLVGGLRSINEFSINPADAIFKIIDYLMRKYGVEFQFNTPISFVGSSYLASEDKSWKSDTIVVCSGSELQILFPQLLREACLEQCHLQMMKLKTKAFVQLGSVLCSGLSLLHYNSFSGYSDYSTLKRKFENEKSAYLRNGIHVMIAQNRQGEILVGDSHHYSNQPQHIIREDINNLILSYLKEFVNLPEYEVTEKWIGTYVSHPSKKFYFERAGSNVWISTGFGGAGMTLSFGQAENQVTQLLQQINYNSAKQNFPVAV